MELKVKSRKVAILDLYDLWNPLHGVERKAVREAEAKVEAVKNPLHGVES